MKLLRRIVESKKFALTTVGSALVAFGASQGLNDLVLQSVTVLYGILVLVQGALDFKFGSASDQTQIQ